MWCQTGIYLEKRSELLISFKLNTQIPLILILFCLPEWKNYQLGLNGSRVLLIVKYDENKKALS